MEEFGGLCCIKGCSALVTAAGLCSKHWRRNKRFGSPVLEVRMPGTFRGMAPEQRFFAQLEKTEGCWRWLSSKDKDGYGLFRGVWSGQPLTRAHRFSWAYHNDATIPAGAIVCHSCDNPECCNPEHLRLGTHEDNQRERRAKGRHGENQTPAAKISPDQVRLIRAATGRQEDIAAQYGITQTTVSDIKRRRSWAHID